MGVSNSVEVGLMDKEEREAIELTKDDLLQKFAEGRPANLSRAPQPEPILRVSLSFDRDPSKWRPLSDFTLTEGPGTETAAHTVLQ